MKLQTYWDGYWDGFMESKGYRKATKAERRKYGKYLTFTASNAKNICLSARKKNSHGSKRKKKSLTTKKT